jgi:type III restriction enzyme
MKLRFEPDLAYQRAAIDAVCDLFKGQEIGRTEFTVAALPASGGPQGELFTGQPVSAQGGLALEEAGLGVGNRLNLLDDEILANLQAVQLRNALAPSEALAGMDFTVEMETGTGKTYVYLRTIFELNRRFGWTKFVIVVPSVAIREGVAKTLEMTREHFRAEYAGAPMDWFVYDSSKLGQVRDFATSATIKIMVATVGALNKLDANVFYKPNEKTGGDKPVDLVRATRPVLIIDEPQSVEGAEEGAGFRALREMNPLCRLRYSATHLKSYHRVYRLDAIDAYEQKLVKRIDVAGVEIAGAHNAPYVKLLNVKTGKGAPTATVEVDVQRKAAVQRETMTVHDGDDLAERTGRDVYRDLSIGTIEGSKGRELVQLNVPGDVRYLRPGDAFGDVDRDSVVRRMIGRTIKEHFEREKMLRPMGIKVLSLFFIDRVDHYRIHNSDGTRNLGPYGVMFEDEYRKLAVHPNYKDSLFGGAPPDPTTAHDGYFSRDKKGAVTEPELNAAGELKNAASREDAERGFQLIMREKEKLLDEKEPLRFIFSHSALREGWDNPNVFQICVLRTMGGDRERRQTVGRGLRLCVDKTGERRRDEGLNVLTVIADESYSAFAEGLQRQIEADLGIRFGTVDQDTFAAIVGADAEGNAVPLGASGSKALFAYLKAQGLIDAAGKITDALRSALKTGTLNVPPEHAAAAPAIRALLTKLAGKLEVRNADDRQTIKLNRQVYLSEEFRALWDKVKTRTTYRLTFDDEALVQDAAKRIAEMPPLARAQLRFVKSSLEIDKGGVHGMNETATPFQYVAEAVTLPDVLGELQNRTNLTRRSLARILTESGRLKDLRTNPALFIDAVTGLIARAKAAAIKDGVRYQRVGANEHYAQELFESEELQGYLKSMVAVSKAPYVAVGYDSGVERAFAEKLDANEAVKVFAKLPSWFTIPTPLGTYNPDWAVLVATDAGDRLYLVVETKGDLFADDLRAAERAKVACGKAHFQAIEDDAGQPMFRLETDADKLLQGVAAAASV